MAELAFGVMGVVPLSLLVLKSHRSAKKKLKTFREHDSEAKRLQKEFDIQRQFFKNEWMILLKLVEPDTGILSSMNGDFSHEKWSDPELNHQLREVLGQNYDTCLAIFKAVFTASHDLEAELERIRPPGDVDQEAIAENHALRKLRGVQDGLRVLRHSKGFATSIEELKSGISQLIALRGQLEKLTEPQKDDNRALTRPAAISEYLRTWSQCTQTRKASTTLHAALAEVWNCSQAGHSKHLFKLFVETGEVQEEIQMRLAIIYDCRTKLEIRSSLANLEVRSRDVTWVEHPSSTTVIADESVPRHSKRLKVVRFEETTISTPICHKSLQEPKNVPDNTPPWESSDLRCSRDICSELTRAASVSPSRSLSSVTLNPDPTCLGHIEVLSKPRFRHTFYSDFGQTFCSSSRSNLSTLSDMIRDLNRDLVDPVDKLRLARALTMAVLKLHSTPWLGQVWQLHDVAMFVDDVEDISKSLDTLHVNVEFARSCAGEMQDVRALNDSQSSHNDRTDEEIRCNIKSRPLYSLGVAFLQIDRWTKVDLGDVVTVRKAADLSSSVSKKFGDLTKRCLDCDFGRGPGTNLTNPALQKKICKSVVGELDHLILLAEQMNLIEPTDEDDW